MFSRCAISAKGAASNRERRAGAACGAGLFRRDPVIALAGVPALLFSGRWQRELTVQSHRRLQRNERFLRSNPAGEGFVEAARLVFANAGENFHAGPTQALEAAA